MFSPALDFTNISRSIKDLYSVAVEAIPGEAVHVYGPLRLVKYTYFLLSEIMPEHDALCQAEGDLMLAYQDGEAQARMQLNALKGQVERFWQRNSSITGL